MPDLRPEKMKRASEWVVKARFRAGKCRLCIEAFSDICDTGTPEFFVPYQYFEAKCPHTGSEIYQENVLMSAYESEEHYAKRIGESGTSIPTPHP